MIRNDFPPSVAAGPSELITGDDLGISAQARALEPLDRVLDKLAPRIMSAPGTLLDLGCGMGALAVRVAGRLGADRVIGVDNDGPRLVAASRRGLETHLVDLVEDPLPVATTSVGVVTCFGVLAYLRTFDNCLGEAHRVLRPGGWLLLSMPNLGSWTNRLTLLLGYQPASVAVSGRHRRAGTVGGDAPAEVARRPAMPPQLHSATLRCMKDLLGSSGFEVVEARGFKPGSKGEMGGAGLAWHLPALARRFIILARKPPG